MLNILENNQNENYNEYHKKALKLMDDLKNQNYESKYELRNDIDSYFFKAFAIEKDNYKLWLDYGNFFYLLKEYHKAHDCCKKAIDLNTKSLAAWKNRGLILQKLGKTRDALDCYSDALVIFPKESSLYFEKSLIHFNKRNYDKALNNCNKALKLDSQNYVYLFHKGIILGNLERFAEGSQNLRRSLDFTPINDKTEVFRKNCSIWIKEFDKKKKSHTKKTNVRITYENGVRIKEGMREDGGKRVRGAFPPILFHSQKDFYMDVDD